MDKLEDLEAKPGASVKTRLPNLNGSGDTVKTVIISVVVTSVIILLMTISGGMGFVTKADFTTNMGNVVIAIEQAKTDLAKTQNDITVATQSIPTLVNSQLGDSVAQSTAQLNNQLATVSGKLTALEGSVQSSSQANATMVNELLAQVDALETEIEDIATRINKLEERITDPDTPIVNEDYTTIWTVSAYTSPITGILTDINSYPYRVEEEGDYGITLDLINTSGVAIPNVIATVTFTPRRNDRVTVDDRDVYLYSYGSSIRWDATIEVRSDGTCRRILFTSERFTLPVNDLTLEMDFTLDY